MNLLHTLAPAFATRHYLAGLSGHLWAAEPSAIEALFSAIASSGAHARGYGEPSEAEAKGYAVKNRRARVSMRGYMFATGPKWLSAYFAMSEHIVAALRAAQEDPEVDDILLEVDSPGGSVLGVEALSEAIAQSAKPVTTYVLHQCASAAYWAVSRSKRIVARPGADLGSLGTYCVVYDASKAFEEAGVKAHVISTGFFKGAGVYGAELTEKQRAEFQARVDRCTSTFKASVGAGRRLEAKALDDLFTGQSWDASRALELGLIDEIENMRSASSGAAPSNSAPGSSRRAEETHMPMSEEDEKTLRAELAAAQAERDKLAAGNTELTNKVAELGAKSAAVTATLAEVEANERKAILDEAAGSTGALAGRITPANREAFEAYAKTVKPEQLRAFLATMPVVSRATATGHSGGTPPPATLGSSTEYSAGDAKVLRLLEVTGKEIDEVADAHSVSITGAITMRDGTVRKAVV